MILVVTSIGAGMAGTAFPWMLFNMWCGYNPKGVIMNGALTVLGLVLVAAGIAAS